MMWNVTAVRGFSHGEVCIERWFYVQVRWWSEWTRVVQRCGQIEEGKRRLCIFSCANLIRYICLHSGIVVVCFPSAWWSTRNTQNRRRACASHGGGDLHDYNNNNMCIIHGDGLGIWISSSYYVFFFTIAHLAFLSAVNCYFFPLYNTTTPKSPRHTAAVEMLFFFLLDITHIIYTVTALHRTAAAAAAAATFT